MASSVPAANGFAFFTQVYPQQSGTVVSGPYIAQNGSPVIGAFVKGEPRALGTVQIMIGGIYILFGIIMAIHADSISIFSGIYFWGGIIYIVSGALTVAADKELYKCLVKGSLGMNIFSTITAGITMILLSLDFTFLAWQYFHRENHDCFHIRSLYQTRSIGITGVLLVLTILEFIISICVSVFACRAVCDCSSEIIHGSNVGQGVLNNFAPVNINSEPVPSKLL